MCVRRVLRIQKKVFRYYETEVTDGPEPPCRRWELNLDSLEDQQVVFTVGPSPQPHMLCFECQNSQNFSALSFGCFSYSCYEQTGFSFSYEGRIASHSALTVLGDFECSHFAYTMELCSLSTPYLSTLLCPLLILSPVFYNFYNFFVKVICFLGHIYS